MLLTGSIMKIEYSKGGYHFYSGFIYESKFFPFFSISFFSIFLLNLKTVYFFITFCRIFYVSMRSYLNFKVSSRLFLIFQKHFNFLFLLILKFIFIFYLISFFYHLYLIFPFPTLRSPNLRFFILPPSVRKFLIFCNSDSIFLFKLH